MTETATLDDIRIRFGTSTPQRQFLFRQLEIVVSHLLSAGSVSRMYLFGSFVSGKAFPNDVDLLVVMNTGFSTTHLGGRSLEVFQHDICRIRYHTDVFWVTEAVGRDRIEELLDVFSRDRNGRDQSIFEVKL